MARAPGPENEPKIGPAMAKHIRALGLTTWRDYLHWCHEMGLAPSLEKSPSEREAELETLARKTAAPKVTQNPRRFIALACAGEIDGESVGRVSWRQLAAAVKRSKADDEKGRESLAAFLLHLEKVSDLVFADAVQGRMRAPYADALVKLHDRRKLWLRDPADWKPDRHNIGRQFGSLARHLFAQYSAPIFMDSVWLRGEPGAYRFRDWFIHVGRGKNIRTAKTPYPLTRMTAHHFMAAPDDYSIEGALMLADIRALGGGERLTRALMGTRLGQRIEKDEARRSFWLSVYRFFVDNPMLDLRHAGPIVDFISFQKFETQEVMVGPGQMERRPPPQPNLSMNRRTPESLLRQVDEWHGDLRKVRAGNQMFWRPSGIQPLDIETGSRDEPVTWRSRELMSAQDLVEEGRLLRHCVSTYAASCARGAYSIWSVEQQEKGERADRQLTVAIDDKGQMVEARGYANRKPTESEQRILQIWMTRANLRPGRYLYGY
jgi:hypothetical protein